MDMLTHLTELLISDLQPSYILLIQVIATHAIS